MEEIEKSMKVLNEKENDFQKINNDNFFFDLDDKLYSLNISKNYNNDKIIIKAKLESNTNINNNYFENCFSLKELIIKSKPFKLCDTIDEALNIFIDILKAKNAYLNKESVNNIDKTSNKLLFIIKINFPGGQQQNAEFELYQKQMNKDEYINELLKTIENLKKENEELKNKNSIQDNEIKLLKKQFLNKYETNKKSNKKNKSFDTKKNLLNSGNINSNYKNYFKYGYNDIHSTNDINKIINCHTLFNSKNINNSKADNSDEYINFKNTNTDNFFFQTSMSSFKKGKLSKNPSESSRTNDFFKSNKISEKDLSETFKYNNKVKRNNLKNFNTTKIKKKDVELNNVIYIKNYLNKITMIPIEEYTSIKQIKINYCAKKCIPIKGKELYYKGIKLNEEKNLEFYKIPWESTLYVLNIPEKINVYVRSLSGKEFKINADETMTILKVKFKIYEYENIPIDNQIVLMDKKILDDEKTIGELNINGDVHLLVRRKDD